MRKHFITIFSIVTVLIQRCIHRYNDELYSISILMAELERAKGDLKRLESDDYKHKCTFEHNETYLHTLERASQTIDDCLYRLKITKENLIKDNYVALKTINRLDAEIKLCAY